MAKFSKSTEKVSFDTLRITTHDNASALKFVSMAIDNDDVTIEESFREDLYGESDGDTEFLVSFDDPDVMHRFSLMWEPVTVG